MTDDGSLNRNVLHLMTNTEGAVFDCTSTHAIFITIWHNEKNQNEISTCFWRTSVFKRADSKTATCFCF
jgi:hypothetical protein